MGVLKNLFQKIFGKKTTKDIDFELVEMDGIVRLENNFFGGISRQKSGYTHDVSNGNREKCVTFTLIV